MSMDGLTKDAQRVAAAGYAVYLEKRKRGIRQGRCENNLDGRGLGRYIKNMSPRDYIDTVAELKRALGCAVYYNGEFVLPDEFIVYMENRFKNSAKGILEFLAQLVP